MASDIRPVFRHLMFFFRNRFPICPSCFLIPFRRMECQLVSRLGIGMCKSGTIWIGSRLGLLGAVLCVSMYLAGNVTADMVMWNASSGQRPDEISAPYSLLDTSPNSPVLSAGLLTLQTDADAELMTYLMVGSELEMPGMPEIEFNMRMVSQETSFPAIRTGATVSITTQNNVGSALYIGTDEVFFLTNGGLRGPSAAIDTDSAFHDYRIEVDGLAAGSQIRLYQDNLLAISHTLITDSGNYGPQARVLFGNQTTVAHGISEWTSFHHNAGVAVPEPSSFLLVSMGWAMAVLRRKKSPSRQ